MQKLRDEIRTFACEIDENHIDDGNRVYFCDSFFKFKSGEVEVIIEADEVTFDGDDLFFTNSKRAMFGVDTLSIPMGLVLMVDVEEQKIYTSNGIIEYLEAVH